MSTRGLLGFVVNGEVKATYNHFDSYPGGLGVDVLTFVRNCTEGGKSLLALKVRAANIRLVDQNVPATTLEVEELQRYANGNVGTRDERDWYVLLRETQGDPGACLDAGVMIEGCDFALDSLWCEWGYLINLDTFEIEVYRGFQTEPHSNGRFSDGEVIDRSDTTMYYPIKLVHTIPFSKLPSDEEFVQLVDPEEE